ncbi:unnamed protein product [Rotaria socialis]|uniref:Helitron helicase-like domain-containing protein n=1 Tax=Rotaria socialis TaxID=392032 RepID=A0A820LK55_9BILA|nr:unnamed protein product [Rotaria socialis]
MEFMIGDSTILHPHCDPMTYPHLFPRGDKGWYSELEKIDQSRNRKRVSMLQFYSYRVAIRATFSAIHCGGKLFKQYIVDAYIKTEQNRLPFYRQNQKVPRVELYQGLMDHLANEAHIEGLRPGRVIILPSSFQGNPRAMQQNYQDAMAVVRKYRKPDLFITFTCNPTWREIQEQLFPGQTPSDRPDLITRVFKLKLNELIDDIFKKHILGRTIANVFVIEFQKRGLPHCHMLIILNSEDKIKSDNHIDRIVCSEMPDAARFPQLHECGHDCANIKLQRSIQECAAAQGGLEWDEIKAHIDARYVKAAWRVFEFPLHDKSHAIIRLAAHLPIGMYQNERKKKERTIKERRKMSERKKSER